MLAVGIPDGATAFVPGILGNLNQMRGARKLSHCIQLWLKTEYISRQLGLPNVIGQFTEEMLPRALDLIARETDHLCAAFAIDLWLNCDLVSPTQREQLQNYRALQLKRTQLVGLPSVRSVLAAALLRAPEDHIAALMSKIAFNRHPSWMTGLLQVILDGYVGGRLSMVAGKQAVDPDQNNLKYGLSCYARRKNGSISAEEAKELALRNSDENSSPIRFLLGPDCDVGVLARNPYFMWVYLRRTILALNYLDWEYEISRTSSQAKLLKTRVSPNPEPILHAAE
jgi:hypothetical protein